MTSIAREGILEIEKVLLQKGPLGILAIAGTYSLWRGLFPGLKSIKLFLGQASSLLPLCLICLYGLRDVKEPRKRSRPHRRSLGRLITAHPQVLGNLPCR
jgi:hypothetical protein